MTTQEKRELDAWIAEHVFNWKPTFAVMKGDLYYREGAHGYTNSLYEAGCYSKEDAERELVRGEPMRIVPHERPHYTTDPAASDVLDDAILKRLGGSGYLKIGVTIAGEYEMSAFVNRTIHVIHPDKKICRALFAKQLFSK